MLTLRLAVPAAAFLPVAVAALAFSLRILLVLVAICTRDPARRRVALRILEMLIWRPSRRRR